MRTLARNLAVCNVVGKTNIIDRKANSREAESHVQYYDDAICRYWTNKNGERHSHNDMPSEIWYTKKDGGLDNCRSMYYIIWHKNGVLHREGDKPAELSTDSRSRKWLQRFWNNGEIVLKDDEEWSPYLGDEFDKGDGLEVLLDGVYCYTPLHVRTRWNVGLEESKSIPLSKGTVITFVKSDWRMLGMEEDTMSELVFSSNGKRIYIGGATFTHWGASGTDECFKPCVFQKTNKPETSIPELEEKDKEDRDRVQCVRWS